MKYEDVDIASSDWLELVLLPFRSLPWVVEDCVMEHGGGVANVL